jgi:hypothetical protein
MEFLFSTPRYHFCSTWYSEILLKWSSDKYCWIWGSLGGVHEKFFLQGYDAMQLIEI